MDFYSDNLFAPGTASALAFKHADCLAGEWVEYATDDVELGVALRAPSAFSGHFSCEFFATEEIHFTPLHEQGNKCQTALPSPGCSYSISMERFRDRKRLIAAMQQFALLFRQRRSYTPVTSIGRGMTASEIARSLKRTPGSIYSRLQRLYRGQRS